MNNTSFYNSSHDESKSSRKLFDYFKKQKIKLFLK